MLLVEVCDTAAPTNIASRPGTLADIHCSASGKCLLAFAPPMSAERILNSIEYTPRTPRTLASKSSLLRDLESVRSNGFAVDEQEYHESRRCIAAPVFNGSNMVVGAVGTTATIRRLTLDRFPLVTQQVKRAAQQLSRELGYKAS